MGNRGIIHDPATRTLLRRHWSTKAWIICALRWKDVRRDVWARQSWTELFFLDEATALAAGHRPCFFCRRQAALSFQAAWAEGANEAAPRARDMDARLHQERLLPLGAASRHCTANFETLPEGVMIEDRGDFLLKAGGRPWRWTPTGYKSRRRRLAQPRLLTPASTVKALRGGYRPRLHSSLAGLIVP